MALRGSALSFLLLGACAAPPLPAGLADDVDRLVAACPGNVAVYFRDLSTGQRLEVASRRVFHAASTMKILVLLKLQQDIADGRYAPADRVDVTTVFPSAVEGEFETAPNTEAVRRAIGGTMTVRELAHWMIVESDNLATNLLIRRAGGPVAVTAHARALGLRETNVARYIMDLAAFEAGLSSRAQPRELGELLERLHRGEVTGSAEALRVMAELGPEWLGLQLPAGTRVAHKTGAISGTRHDAGIVEVAPGRAFVLCVFTDDLADESAGEHTIAGLARLLYDAVRGGA